MEFRSIQARVSGVVEEPQNSKLEYQVEIYRYTVERNPVESKNIVSGGSIIINPPVSSTKAYLVPLDEPVVIGTQLQLRVTLKADDGKYCTWKPKFDGNLLLFTNILKFYSFIHFRIVIEVLLWYFDDIYNDVIELLIGNSMEICQTHGGNHFSRPKTFSCRRLRSNAPHGVMQFLFISNIIIWEKNAIKWSDCEFRFICKDQFNQFHRSLLLNGMISNLWMLMDADLIDAALRKCKVCWRIRLLGLQHDQPKSGWISKPFWWSSMQRCDPDDRVTSGSTPPY